MECINKCNKIINTYNFNNGQQQQLGGQAEPHQSALHATAGRELGDPQHLVVHVETHQAVLQSHQAPGLLQGCALGEPQYLGDPQYLGVYAIWIQCSHNVSNAYNAITQLMYILCQ